jgi:hypothetical protein
LSFLNEILELLRFGRTNLIFRQWIGLGRRKRNRLADFRGDGHPDDCDCTATQNTSEHYAAINYCHLFAPCLRSSIKGMGGIPISLLVLASAELTVGRPESHPECNLVVAQPG